MIRTVSKVNNVFRLFGIPIFSSDYTVTEIEESNVCEEVQPVPVATWNRFGFERDKRRVFLEKLYNQDNNKNNLDEEQS